MSVISAIAGFAVSASASIYCGKRSLQEWREFRRGKGQELLLGIDDRDLANLPIAWPLRRTRWPIPQPLKSHDGTEDQAGYESARYAAYARLAERAHRRASIAGQALIVFGGALLGLMLPATWKVATSLDRSPEDLAVLSPLLVVVLGLLIGDAAKDYQMVQGLYENAATPVAPHREVVDGRAPWWERALAKLSGR